MSKANEQRLAIDAAIKANMNGDLEGIIIGVMISDGKVQAVCSINGSNIDVGLQLAEALKRIMDQTEVSQLLQSSMISALVQHAPAAIAPAVHEMIAAAATQVPDCGDPGCMIHHGSNDNDVPTPAPSKLH